MDPQTQFCHNPTCCARGQVGQGNIRIFSKKEQRYQCLTCRETFAATKGTPFYRLHKPSELMVVVATRLSHNCPIQAIVAAFGLDERTVARWQVRAGEHCQRVHAHLVQQAGIDLGHVQADEMWIKVGGGKVWMAMACAVPFRLWLGGVVSARRDRALIMRLIQKVASCAASFRLLVCVDGLASYTKACLRVLRHRVRTGRRGRPRLVLEEGLLVGQVIKQYVKRRVARVTARVVHGTREALRAVLAQTGTGTAINIAYMSV